MAMERAGAVLLQRATVLGRGVAFVRGKAVLRMDLVELAHEGVAVDLRYDGCSGDGETESIAIEEPGLRAGVIDAEGIDEQMIGRYVEALDSEEHGETRGLVDIDRVYGLGCDLCNTDGDGHAADAAIHGFTVLAGHLFGIFQAALCEGGDAFRKDYRSGDDRAKERSPADFINACDPFEAVVAERLLGRIAADEELQHPLLRSGGFYGLRRKG